MAEPWPERLAWIVPELQPTTLQRTKLVRTDGGPPEQRPLHAARRGLRGSVSVSEPEFRQLQSMAEAGRVFRFEDLDGRRSMLTFWEPPQVEQEKLAGGKPYRLLVQVVLTVHPTG